MTGATAGAAPAVRPAPRLREVAHTLLVALVVVPLTVLLASGLIVLRLLRASSFRLENAVERFWSAVILRVSGVQLDVRGRERLRPGRPYIIMPTHRSWFDIPVLTLALESRDARWVGKKELLPIPFFGWWFALSRNIVIDRADRAKAVAAIRRAALASVDGVSIVIFPEGTRSLTGELLPFKKGGFHLALDTGLEILPVAVRGTGAVMPKRAWTIRPGPVEVVFGEPVPVEGRARSELGDLMAVVRERIRQALDPSRVEEVR